jgi:CheY-like chemotaxis protein
MDCSALRLDFFTSFQIHPTTSGVLCEFFRMDFPISQSTSPGLRALVVDDNRDSAEAFAVFLSSNQFQVEIALDGTEALRKALKIQPDLVLLDIHMPKLDGYDTCRIIRAQPWGYQTFLVAVTGLPLDEIRSRSTEVGFDAYLMKPVSYQNLQSIVDSRLKLRKVSPPIPNGN